MAFLKIFGSSLAAALVGYAVAYVSFIAYYRILEPTDANDIRGWQDFAALMGSGLGAGIGFMLGASIGTFRWWRRQPGA